MKHIIIMQSTCRALEYYGRLVANNRYDDILTRYVSSPGIFRNLLDINRAVIGGSCALEFLLGNTNWKPNDLDIFVRAPYLSPFLLFLHHEGFKRVQPWEEETVPNRQIPCVEASIKFVKGKVSIDLILTTLANSFDGIIHSWSTVMMNGITGANAFCAYPQYTFHHLASISIPKTIALQHTSYGDDKQKYESRNFQFTNALELNPQLDYHTVP